MVGLARAGRPIDIPPCGCSADLCPPITEGAPMTTMPELQPAAAETCAPEPHVWVAHMRGGEPIHVEICMGCGQFNWDGLREQVAALIAAAPSTTTDHPEDTCGRCGGPNIPWSAPSPLWNEVMRGGDINATDTEFHHGIVCPTCFAILAEKAGIADLWQLSAKRVHVPLATVTPSGRVWNERTWLWDEPYVGLPNKCGRCGHREDHHGDTYCLGDAGDCECRGELYRAAA